MVFCMQVVQQALRAHPELSGIPVVSKVPRHRPEVFIRVEQTAPTYPTLRTVEATVMVQTYAPRVDQAVRLSQIVLATLTRLADTHRGVLAVDGVRGPYEFNDPDLPSTERWQTTADVVTDSNTRT